MLVHSALFSAQSQYFKISRQNVPYFNLLHQRKVVFDCFATKTILNHAEYLRPAFFLKLGSQVNNCKQDLIPRSNADMTVAIQASA